MMSKFRRFSCHLFLLIFSSFVSACAGTLHSAVESGDLEAVRQAINRGESTEISTWAGSPVNPAIENNDLAIIKLLHENGAEILPAHLSVATKAGAISTFGYLMDAGADIYGCYLDTDYPGWWGGAEVGSIIPSLGSAVMRNDVKSVEALLILGAPIESNCKVPTGLGENYRFSSILAAGIAGDPKVTEVLITAGAEPNRLSAQGRTPLSLAAERGHYEAARVLLANGAFHTYTTQIKQPIEYAIDAGNEDIVDLLVYAGAVRPKRRDPSEAWAKVGSAVLEGVKFAAGLYVIYLGARYSNYDSSYSSGRSSEDAGDIISSVLSSGSSDSQRSDDRGECRSDFDCGSLEFCVKKPLHAGGICVNDGGQTRLSRDHDSTQSGFARSDADPGPKDCPLRTHWDLIYMACIN